MRVGLLDILRCPFCGASLSFGRGGGFESHGNEVRSGILTCHCSAFPIVDGIPVFLADRSAEAATRLLDAGDSEQALRVMLGLDESRHEDFQRFVDRGPDATYEEGVELFCADAEGPYLMYRFSDPTFIVGQALVRALGSDRQAFGKRALDLCGGSGHFTRVLCQISGTAEVVQADSGFWKQWLAKRIIAPDCQPVCCDANRPLPFARDTFSFITCSDAYHYIWSKRSLAAEIMRAIDDRGIIVLAHLHNARCENISAGMALPPEWYRDLFVELEPRLFKESAALERLLGGQGVDLSIDYTDDELREEPALCLVATNRRAVYRTSHIPAARPSPGPLRINPLYRVERADGMWVLRLCFPSEEYEAEFAACKRYLPGRVELRADALHEPTATTELRELVERHVLLDLPANYCRDEAR